MTAAGSLNSEIWLVHLANLQQTTFFEVGPEISAGFTTDQLPLRMKRWREPKRLAWMQLLRRLY